MQHALVTYSSRKCYRAWDTPRYREFYAQPRNRVPIKSVIQKNQILTTAVARTSSRLTFFVSICIPPRRRLISAVTDARKLLINSRARRRHPSPPHHPNYSVYFNPFRIGHTLVISTKLARALISMENYSVHAHTQRKRASRKGASRGGAPSPPSPPKSSTNTRRTEAAPPPVSTGVKFPNKGRGGWRGGEHPLCAFPPRQSRDRIRDEFIRKRFVLRVKERYYYPLPLPSRSR